MDQQQFMISLLKKTTFTFLDFQTLKSKNKERTFVENHILLVILEEEQRCVYKKQSLYILSI